MASAVALVVTHPRILRRLRISSCRIWMSMRPGGSLRPRISLIHQHIFRRRPTTPARCQDIRSENHEHSSSMLLPLPHRARYPAALHMMICGTRQLRVRLVRPPYALCQSSTYHECTTWSPPGLRGQRTRVARYQLAHNCSENMKLRRRCFADRRWWEMLRLFIVGGLLCPP